MGLLLIVSILFLHFCVYFSLWRLENFSTKYFHYTTPQMERYGLSIVKLFIVNPSCCGVTMDAGCYVGFGVSAFFQRVPPCLSRSASQSFYFYFDPITFRYCVPPQSVDVPYCIRIGTSYFILLYKILSCIRCWENLVSNVVFSWY